MVLYAVYADCDPITAGQVKKKDQVRVNQLYGRAVEREPIIIWYYFVALYLIFLAPIYSKSISH